MPYRNADFINPHLEPEARGLPDRISADGKSWIARQFSESAHLSGGQTSWMPASVTLASGASASCETCLRPADAGSKICVN